MINWSVFQSYGIKTLSLFLLFLCLVILALNFDPDVMKIDKGIYLKYTESVLEDGDLNIINQSSPKERWIATQTYNHPDFHDHGLVLLWSPFFYYSKTLTLFKFDNTLKNHTNYSIAQVAANIFWGICFLILCFKLMGLFYLGPGRLKSIILFIMGTPFLWYFCLHPFNSDISSSVLPVVLLLYYLLLQKNDSKSDWYALGLFSGISSIIKISMVFYFILFGHFLLSQFQKGRHYLINRSLLIILGLFSIIPFFFYNETIKYGFIYYGYFSTLNLDYYLLGETLWGPVGYLYISPLYILIPLTFGIYLYEVQKKELSFFKNYTQSHSLFLFLASIPLIKLLSESFTFTGNGELGARQYIIDSFVFLLLLHPLFNSSPKGALKKTFKKFLIFFAITSTLWMTLIYFWFWFNLPSIPYIWGESYINDLQFLPSSASRLMNNLYLVFREMFSDILSLINYWPLFFFSSFFLVLLSSVKLSPSNYSLIKKNIKLFIYLLSFGYIGVTLSNSYNNPRNVQKMKREGFYKNIVIGNGPHIYMFDENVGALQFTQRFGKTRGDIEMQKKAQGVLEKYLIEVQREVLIDPIMFKSDLEKGIIRKSYN
jgi:hypothetical protein